MITEKKIRNPLRKQSNPTRSANSLERRPSFKGHEKILSRMGFDIFVDEYVDPEYYYYIEKFALDGIKTIHRHYKGIIKVSKKVKVFVADFKKNPEVLKHNTTNAPAFYLDKVIYIDQYSVDERDYWIHEYAHYLSYQVPERFVKYAMEEYKNMLQEYFKYYVGKRTKRKDLGSEKYDNPKHRAMMAEKLGLPSEYSTTNMDEFFAEMLTHWPKIPNNKLTFRLKQSIRNILMRL